MTTFDDFLAQAWAEHGDRPVEVGERIAASMHLVTSPQQVDPFARLLAHVFGEHLGAFDRGVALLESLGGRAVCDATSEKRAIALRIAMLHYAAGDRGALATLPADDAVNALATAASMLAGRNDFAAALAAYGDALQRCGSQISQGSPVARALAVGGNNLAAALEQKQDRTAVETDGMVQAAQAALTYWRIAGGWLEHERAEYRLARSLLQAQRASEAVAAATRCIDLCRTNAAPALELFFAKAVLALAQRQAGNEQAFACTRRDALEVYARVSADEQRWCVQELRDLDATSTS